MSDALTGYQPFTYATLEPAEADVARAAADAIRTAMSRSVREVGDHLIRAKEALPHGAFRKWCEDELDITPRSAQRYMEATRFLADKCDTLSLLPAMVLYELASPKTDLAIVAEIVTAAESSDPLAAAEVKRRLSNAKQDGLLLERMASRSPKATPEQLKERLRKQRAEDRESNRKLHEEQAVEAARSRAAAFKAAAFLFEKLTSADIATLIQLMDDTEWHRVQAVFLPEYHFRSARADATAESVERNYRLRTAEVVE